jgi:hypothetical protein
MPSMIIRTSLPSIVFHWKESANHLLKSVQSAENVDGGRNLMRFDYVAQRNCGFKRSPPVGVLVNSHIPNES